jgi:uncharacterized protein DUF3574
MRIGSTVVLLLALASFPYSGEAQQSASTQAKAAVVQFDRYFRTELYLGRDKPGGGQVSDDEWEKFLSEVATPKFPDGFTVLEGRGQYRDKSGTIVREPSKVLVFLYKKQDRRAASGKIEEIRSAYVKQFNQESVMRIDFRKSVEVAF